MTIAALPSVGAVVRPRLIGIDEARSIYCPSLSPRGWRNHIDRAVVGDRSVVISIGRRKFCDVDRLEQWLDGQSQRGGR